MKFAVVAAFLVVVAVAWARPEEHYTTKFDNIDVDAILNNKRLLENYAQCIKGNDKVCTAEGRELRRILPEAIETECAKCSDFQKKKTGETLKKLFDNHRAVFDDVYAIIDPKGELKENHAKYLEEIGIKL